MLPFMQPKKMSSVIMTKIRPSGETETDGEQGENIGLEAAAEDLLRAVASKDVKAVAEALQAAFDVCDSAPHVEGPHIDRG